MTNDPKSSSQAADLRRLAEQRLSEEHETLPLTDDETRHLVHELQFHQIELEMQNEELLHARAESEATLGQYADVYESIPMGIFTLDRDGTIRRANSPGANLLRTDRAALLNRRFGLFVSVDYRPTFNDFIVKVFASEATETCEVALLREGDEPIWAKISASPSRDRPECHIVVVDITKSKQSDNALREAEQFLHSTLDAMESHVAILDETGRIVAVNEAWRAFARTNGIDPGRVCEGANYLQTCDQASGEDSEVARSVARNIRAVLRGERDVFNAEYPCHSPDEQRWFSMHVTRFSGDGLSRAVVVHQTITARKLVEESLRQSERQFRGIIENVQDAYFRGDKTGRVVMASPSAVRMFGFGSADEIIGMNVATLYRLPEDRQAILVELRQKGGVEDRIVEGSRKDGSTFWVSLNARACHDDQGRFLGTEAFVRDITERNRAEEDLRASEARYRSLFENMLNGLAYCRILMDQDRPYDFIYLAVNNAFSTLTGLQNVVGKRVSEVIPGIRESDPELFVVYGRVALTGVPEMLETYVQALGMWFAISIYSPAREYFVCVFDVITERKRAEESLRQSERQFREIIENVQDAYFRADMAGRLVMVSPSATRMYGFASAEEMIGMDAATLYRFPEEGQAIMDEICWKGSIEDRAREGRRKDGSTFWVSLNSRVNRDEQGRFLGTESFVRDISERKRTDANYRLMAETLRLWNRGDDLHSLLRETLRVIRVLTDFDAVGLRLRMGDDFPYFEQSGFSEAFVQVENCLCAKDAEGHVGRDAAGQPVLECACGLVLSGRTDPDNPCCTEGGSFWSNASAQLLAISPEFDPRTNPRNRCIQAGYESVALIPLRSGDGIVGLLQLNAHRPGQFTLEFVRFFEGLATALGIALQRKQAEEAVQRSEMQLRAMTDSVPDAIFLKDRDSRMQFTNPAALTAIGKPREAVIGKTDAEYCDDPSVGHALMSNDRRVMKLGQTLSIEEILPTPRGPRIFLTTKSPFRDGQGRIVGVVGVARDITDHKREEDSLRQREAELAQLSRVHVVGEMAAALAHELNQPLYAINNYVGGIESRLRQMDALPGAEEIIAAILQASKEVSRAAAIVDRLREFVRGRDVHRSSVDIIESLHHVIELMDPLARGKGVVLTMNASKGIPIIQADPIQIEQVIVNLVANAIDAVAELPEGKRQVTVRASVSAAKAVEIVVQDGGHGVPPELRDTLFEAFVSTKKDGLGVGLTISRTIVQSHGGKIWMVHHEPQGTSVHFTVPLAHTEKEPQYAE